MHEKYHGKDHVQTANGRGMRITHIGQSIIPTSSHTLHLKNILHVPSVTRNLLLVKIFTSDNNVFFEFILGIFLLRIGIRERFFLEGVSWRSLQSWCFIHEASFQQCQDVTCSMVLTPWSSNHSYHPAYFTSSWASKAFVCDAYQQGKSHQLPFSLSTHFTTAPLEIIYSDVWGPAQTSVSGYQVYVSFVDAYSRFTWLYLLKHKSDVFQIFLHFQHVERLLNKKIIHVQID
jgi:histone deacetylase 1/2